MQTMLNHLLVACSAELARRFTGAKARWRHPVGYGRLKNMRVRRLDPGWWRGWDRRLRRH